MPGKRILLVDYDPRSLTHTREVLEGAGFDVSTCGDGLTAIDQYKTLSPDLVLLSAMLPKMHGFEVCSNIRKLPGGDRTPVVIITDVYKGKRYRVDAINKYGASEYIEKPIDDSSLVTILRGLVKDNGQSLASAIDDGERTVQFSRDMLNKMVQEEVTGASKPTSEKKTVSDKSKGKDEISKKLEESLAGLDLELGRKSQRSKPKDSAATEIISAPKNTFSQPQTSKAESSDQIFTSEDLFTDVIASVERELQSEKTVPQAATEPEPTISIAAPSGSEPTKIIQTPVSSEPTVQMQKPAATRSAESSRKLSFDDEMERKLSNTLSGLKKERHAASAKSSTSAPKISEPGRPSAPAVAKPSSEPTRQMEVPVSRAEEPPQAATSVIKPVPVKDAIPAAVAAKVIEEEGINFGQYLLLQKIATGGMAELFLAKRKGVEGFEKILAIKRILPHMSDNEEFVTMFIDEAKLAAQLTHHNICQIFDLGKIENAYYIAMEYVNGKDLRAILKASRTKTKPMSVDLAVLVISKIASALDYAHRKRGSNGQPLNLVHRDVSPQNILISYEGEVKLVDFGIAKAATKAHVTQHGALKGKLLYMSPEQAWGKAVDKRSDIFSLGVVLYELLTGRPLFFDENDTEVTILEKVREAKITPAREFNSRVPVELEKIVGRALKKSPDERYQSAYEMQKDLDNLFYSESYTATGATLAYYVRDLFPDESHEGEMKEKHAEEPSKPVGASVATDMSAPEKAKPEPVPEKPKPAPEPASAKPADAPITPVKEKPASKPQAEAAIAPKTDQKGVFRDISAPDIIAPQASKPFPIIPVGIVGAILLAVVAYVLFRPSHSEPVKTAQTQTAAQPASTTPAPAPTPTPATEAPAAAEAPAAETKEPAVEDKNAEAKKLAEQKAEEEKNKKEAEEAKKKEEAKLKEDQKQAQQKVEEAKPEPAPVEEQKVAEAQPAPAQVQETTPPQQQQQQEPAKEAPKKEEPQKVEPKKVEPKPEPAVPAVNEGDLVELTPDVVKPELIKSVKPNYPPAAMKQKVEGTVVLSLLVTETGKVGDVKVLRSAGGATGLDEAAAAAVRKWTFRPAVKAGKKVKVWVTYPVVFKLQD